MASSTSGSSDSVCWRAPAGVGDLRRSACSRELTAPSGCRRVGRRLMPTAPRSLMHPRSAGDCRLRDCATRSVDPDRRSALRLRRTTGPPRTARPPEDSQGRRPVPRRHHVRRAGPRQSAAAPPSRPSTAAMAWYRPKRSAAPGPAGASPTPRHGQPAPAGPGTDLRQQPALADTRLPVTSTTAGPSRPSCSSTESSRPSSTNPPRNGAPPVRSSVRPYTSTTAISPLAPEPGHGTRLLIVR